MISQQEISTTNPSEHLPDDRCDPVFARKLRPTLDDVLKAVNGLHLRTLFTVEAS